MRLQTVMTIELELPGLMVTYIHSQQHAKIKKGLCEGTGYPSNPNSMIRTIPE